MRAREVVRPQVRYDYGQAPHEGRTNYECWQWWMSAREVSASLRSLWRADVERTGRRLLLVAYPLLPVSEESAGGAEQILWTLERELARARLGDGGGRLRGFQGERGGWW